MTDATKRRAGATARARMLRQEETEAEFRLWGELRGRHLNGHKFVRQVPLGPYFADFLCRRSMLVVEIDGSHHADLATDPSRTKWLNGQGYSVLRFWNHEVLAERRSVLETILAVIDGKIVAPSPDLRFAPATLSPSGRGVVAAAPISPLPIGERVAFAAKRRSGEGVLPADQDRGT